MNYILHNLQAFGIVALWCICVGSLASVFSWALNRFLNAQLQQQVHVISEDLDLPKRHRYVDGG